MLNSSNIRSIRSSIRRLLKGVYNITQPEAASRERMQMNSVSKVFQQWSTSDPQVFQQCSKSDTTVIQT
eukprot:1051104-Heterocapsa_arctica.AAC.1